MFVETPDDWSEDPWVTRAIEWLYGDVAIAMVTSITRDRHTSEDIINDVALAVLTSPAVRGAASNGIAPERYLSSMLKNAAYTWHRRNRRLTVVEPTGLPEPGDGSAEDTVMDAEERTVPPVSAEDLQQAVERGGSRGGADRPSQVAVFVDHLRIAWAHSLKRALAAADNPEVGGELAVEVNRALLRISELAAQIETPTMPQRQWLNRNLVATAVMVFEAEQRREIGALRGDDRYRVQLERRLDFLVAVALTGARQVRASARSQHDGCIARLADANMAVPAKRAPRGRQTDSSHDDADVA